MQNARGRQGGQNKENHADEQGKGPKKGEKERQAKRAERKLRQKELTVNISAAYQTIRPTIIQAQRILKIIDSLQAKFSITKYLNFEFVKHFEPQETQAASNLNSDSVSRLSKVTRGYLAKIAYIQSKIYELLEQEAPQQSETGEEEDDGYSKRDDDDDEDNKEAQERKAREEAEKEKLRQERENQVLTFRDKMEGDFNNLVRQLERDSSDYEIIKSLNPKANRTESYVDTNDCLESIKFIYLKKMSTGFDEDVSHKSMLDDLARKIKAAEQTEQSKVLELKKLETDKKKYKEEQDAEISKLKAQMSKIKQDEEDGLSALKAKEQKSISIENADQEEKYKRHETIVNDGRKDLEELEKTNEEAQNKKLQEAKMKYLNYTKTHKDQYDELLLVSKQTMEKLQEENAKVEAEMTKVEDEYRRLMHEKEINEAIELEWQTKIQKFQMHEERKEKSAQFVVNMWRAWKKNKKGGKKKPKPKK